MIALRGLVVFPNSTVHFDVGRKRSAAALDLAIKKGTPVFLVTQRDVRHDDPDLGELYDIGTIAVIKQAAHNRAGTDPFIGNEDKLTVKSHL